MMVRMLELKISTVKIVPFAKEVDFKKNLPLYDMPICILVSLKMRTVIKEMPSILLCWPMMSEADVGGVE